MISHEEQSELIKRIGMAGGYRYGEFTAAAGIRANFDIQLDKALEADAELKGIFVDHMVSELADVEMIAAVGGAVALAREVAYETGVPLIEVETRNKPDGKSFKLKKPDRSFLRVNQPKVGFIEDVSNSLQTVGKVTQGTRLSGLVVRAVAAWRRGEPLPSELAPEDLPHYNSQFNFKYLYEEPLDFPVTGVIERKVPLWLPTEPMIRSWLPELEAA